MKTVWLLDVDGVLNANRPAWKETPKSGEAFAGGMSFRIRWAPSLASRIRALHRAGTVEITWCTTWCAYADQIEQLLGLPELARAFTADINGEEASLAKAAAALRVVEQGHRLIWTDDLEVPRSGDLHRALTKDRRSLLIRPFERRGLTPEHMDRIEAFAAAARASAAETAPTPMAPGPATTSKEI